MASVRQNVKAPSGRKVVPFRVSRNVKSGLVEQTVSGFRQAIRGGFYKPGDTIPPVRDLALQAGVNPNTMQRAFAELERLELVTSARTAGRFVTEDADRIHCAREELARQQVTEFLKNMQLLGFSTEESRALLNSYETEDTNA